MPNTLFSVLKYKHCSEVVNQRLHKDRFPSYLTRKRATIEGHYEELWHPDRLTCEFEKWLGKKHWSKIVNQLATKKPIVNLKRRKWAVDGAIAKKIWYQDRLHLKYEKWLDEKERKEVTSNNYLMVILCHFSLWFNLSFSKLTDSIQDTILFSNSLESFNIPVLINLLKHFSIAIQYKLWLKSKFFSFMNLIVLSVLDFLN